MRRLLVYVGHFITFTALAPLIIVNVAASIRAIFGIPDFDLGDVGSFLGGSVVGLGLTTMAWAEIDMYRFGRGGSPVPFYDPPRRLVREGIYGCTRNPMYLGTFVEYVGVSLIVGCLPMILLSLLMLFAALLLYRCYEVPYLKDKFGIEVNEYLSSTPLLFPSWGCIKGLIKGVLTRRSSDGY
jgi:protein-S-isoprenylcysteine O-methyltransferase Ste14